MPGLAVSINGNEVATVSTEGLNLLSVRVSGDLTSDDFATLDVSGGLYGEGGSSQHLIWVNLVPLIPGDEVAVSFLERATTSRAGKTIDELFPEKGQSMGPWEPLEKVLDDLAKEPKVRQQFNFEVTPPTGDVVRAATMPEDHSFGFSVDWAWKCPGRARVSLSSASLDNIVNRVGGTYHAEFKLELGQGVKLRVDV